MKPGSIAAFALMAAVASAMGGCMMVVMHEATSAPVVHESSRPEEPVSACRRTCGGRTVGVAMTAREWQSQVCSRIGFLPQANDNQRCMCNCLAGRSD
jgi:hypothetical protein